MPRNATCRSEAKVCMLCQAEFSWGRIVESNQTSNANPIKVSNPIGKTTPHAAAAVPGWTGWSGARQVSFLPETLAQLPQWDRRFRSAVLPLISASAA